MTECEQNEIEHSILTKSLELIDKYIIRSVTDTCGNITDVSEAFCKISGYSKSELIGKPHSIVRHPDMPKSLFSKLWKTINSGKVFEGEIKNLRKDGSYYWVDVHIEPNFDNNKIVSYTAIRHDITSKKKLQALNISQLKYHQKKELENVKFTAIGQLAAGMTHEINTPLTYIKGNFEMIKLDMESLPNSDIKTRMLEDSEKIIDGINRLANIVESMREMSQKSKETKESTNIYHTLVTSLTLIYNRSKQISNIKLNGDDFQIGFDKNKETFVSSVQKQRIEQAWVVIINNALDELVKIDNFDKRLIGIDIFYSEDKKYIITKIKDNAGGIDKGIVNNIFEPFVSNKESSGMGVGLNIAKKIIEEQDGSIIAYNEDNGAVFEVKLKSMDLVK
jgi:PAS domain S-box-containing protein